jgi:hypothetical protein
MDANWLTAVLMVSAGPDGEGGGLAHMTSTAICLAVPRKTREEWSVCLCEKKKKKCVFVGRRRRKKFVKRKQFILQLTTTKWASIGPHMR